MFHCKMLSLKPVPKNKHCVFISHLEGLTSGLVFSMVKLLNYLPTNSLMLSSSHGGLLMSQHFATAVK